MYTIGSLLKEIRISKGLSQVDVAKALKMKTNGYVSQIENGLYAEPDESTLRNYAKALGITWGSMLQIRRKARLMDMGIKEENIFLEMIRIPILGSVPCGTPQEAIEDAGEFLPLPDDGTLSKKKDLFGLRANGLSMKDAGILPGDIMIIDPYASINNGDIVVAKINDNATLKYYYERGGYVELRPANDDFKPIKTNDPSFVIVGKVIRKIAIEKYE
ncbi:MAG: S24 family peptidase [Candidatus Dojkabacteria bacterium]|jgi:SOS regulatory protein LexA|nr:MAG: S24 family peptidase [Candidatus Dojkabacteria bacterium]